MNYLIILLSFGLCMRGVLYYLASVNSISSKFNKLSVTKTDDYKEYIRDNKIAFISYIVIGSIVSIFLIILNFISKELLLDNYIVFIIGIFVLDFLVNILINIKIKITNWDELQKEED